MKRQVFVLVREVVIDQLHRVAQEVNTCGCLQLIALFVHYEVTQKVCEDRSLKLPHRHVGQKLVQKLDICYLSLACPSEVEAQVLFELYQELLALNRRGHHAQNSTEQVE